MGYTSQIQAIERIYSKKYITGITQDCVETGKKLLEQIKKDHKNLEGQKKKLVSVRKKNEQTQIEALSTPKRKPFKIEINLVYEKLGFWAKKVNKKRKFERIEYCVDGTRTEYTLGSKETPTFGTLHYNDYGQVSHGTVLWKYRARAEDSEIPTVPEDIPLIEVELIGDKVDEYTLEAHDFGSESGISGEKIVLSKKAFGGTEGTHYYKEDCEYEILLRKKDELNTTPTHKFSIRVHRDDELDCLAKYTCIETDWVKCGGLQY